MPISVLYLITDLNIGGTEKMLYETVKRLDKTKYLPVVCSLKSYGYYAKKISEENIEVKNFNIHKTFGFFLPIGFLKVILEIKRLIKERNAAIVHTFLFQANIIGKISVWLSGLKIPVISSIRVMEKQKKWHLFFEKLTSDISTKFLVNSNALKNFLIEKKVAPSEKIEVIYNGIDVENLTTGDRDKIFKEFNVSPESTLIVTCGRLHKQKGIEFLIDALSSLTFSPSHFFTLLIIGDGPERKNLERKVKKLGLEKKVIFTGWRTDSQKIISCCDIFILPSLWEGTPNVILEAMAYGKPIIATSVGGVPELITHMVDGVLVPPGDTPALANAIQFVVSNKEKAIEFGKKAKEKISQKFRIEKMIQETENFYGRLNLYENNNSNASI